MSVRVTGVEISQCGADADKRILRRDRFSLANMTRRDQATRGDKCKYVRHQGCGIVQPRKLSRLVGSYYKARDRAIRELVTLRGSDAKAASWTAGEDDAQTPLYCMCQAR